MAGLKKLQPDWGADAASPVIMFYAADEDFVCGFRAEVAARIEAADEAFPAEAEINECVAWTATRSGSCEARLVETNDQYILVVIGALSRALVYKPRPQPWSPWAPVAETASPAMAIAAGLNEGGVLAELTRLDVPTGVLAGALDRAKGDVLIPDLALPLSSPSLNDWLLEEPVSYRDEQERAASREVAAKALAAAAAGTASERREVIEDLLLRVGDKAPTLRRHLTAMAGALHYGDEPETLSYAQRNELRKELIAAISKKPHAVTLTRLLAGPMAWITTPADGYNS